ncbi:MAG TPA: cation-transporting P-type ATPase [Acidimicrobiales bacterium]|nr:cation-transporting P-type ATPase [Acidimicrobiales bacterium]
MTDSLTNTAPGGTGQPQPPAWHVLDVSEVLAVHGVEADQGLSEAEAARRIGRYGPNRFAEAPTEPVWRSFLRQYRDKMQIVLLVAGILSLWPLKVYGTGILLVVLTLFNALMGMRQEGKAAAAVAALSKMMIIKARVRRSGELTELPAEQLVPGDIVSVEAGDVIPADGRLINAANLEIDESALTGESLPAAKGVDPVPGADTPLGDRVDMAYMNTNVTRGSGTLVVTATGMDSEVGHISGLLEGTGQTKTPLTRQLEKLTDQILVIAGVALLISFAINLARGLTFKEVFTASVAFAIAAIPTGLPAVVTAILSKGTQLLAQAGAIMKQLRSTETLGATSAINSDKTGTLTLNQMTAVQLLLVERQYAVTGTGYGTEGRINRVAGESEVDLDRFLMPMVLASDAVVRDAELIGDPTEGALVVLAAKGGVDAEATRQTYPRLATLPFDAAYKLMATFHQVTDDAGQSVVRAYVKGAPDQLLARATTYLDAGLAQAPLGDPAKERYLGANERLGEQGLRVMATAYRDFEPGGFDAGGDLLASMQDLTLLSMVGIVDPPRPQARVSIETARAAGVRVRMITGDHAVTAEAIASDLGIEGRAITGAEFAAMSDEEATQAIDGIGVIARVTPEDKVRLVEVLQRRGEIVAMTGDGVNDAPALKKADIGIAMGITGTEVSKEAAVMILTDDDFSTIVHAVDLGRGLYDNLVRYVRFQMGCLFGFIVSFLGASIFNIAGGVPFLPLQTIWINFAVQVPQAIGLGYGKPAEGLMAEPPRPANEPVLSRGLLVWLAFVGLVMGTVTLAIISWAWDAHGEVVARTMGFVAFAVADVLLSYESRDQLKSMFRMDVFGDKTFLTTTGIAVGVIYLSTTFSPFQRFLDTTPLDLNQWLLCIAAGTAVVWVSEIRKLVLRRRAAAGGGLPPLAPEAAVA